MEKMQRCTGSGNELRSTSFMLANAERKARRDGKPDATWPIRERLAAGYLRQGRFAVANG